MVASNNLQKKKKNLKTHAKEISYIEVSFQHKLDDHIKTGLSP